jgi:hypothetical protein
VDTYCIRAKAITMSPNDVLTEDTFQQIVTNNKMWLSNCGPNVKK